MRTLGKPAHKATLAVLHVHVVRPNVCVSIFVLFILAGLNKPRVLI